MTDTPFERELATFRERTPRSAARWAAARRRTPGGVHSNDRAVAPYPLFIARASGARIWDVDDHAYLDFDLANGAALAGHAHPRIAQAISDQASRGVLYGHEAAEAPEAAERLGERFGLPQVRFSTTGLEAEVYALRLSRAITGHRYLLKVEGALHSGSDAVLVGVHPAGPEAGPIDAPRSAPESSGLLGEAVERTRVVPFNDLESTREIARASARDVAALLVEPVATQFGLVLPEPEYLAGLRDLADELGALLWFDETRTAAMFPRGATGRFGVLPDGLLLGSALAGGVPFSALATRAGLLDAVRPGGVAHQGATYANPVAIAALRAGLDHVFTAEHFDAARALAARLAAGWRSALEAAGIPATVPTIGPSGSVFFASRPVREARDLREIDAHRSRLVRLSLLNRGLLPGGPGPADPWSVSALHTVADVERYLDLLPEVLGAPRTGPDRPPLLAPPT